VTFARALSNTFAGIAPASAPLFIAAQVAGAVLATVVFGWLLGGARTRPASTHARSDHQQE
jgi:membrane protein DedA with SNARE-associated domain